MLHSPHLTHCLNVLRRLAFGFGDGLRSLPARVKCARALARLHPQPRWCWPYPSLFDTSTSAPAKMRAAVMSVCPMAAAAMSAVYLPTNRLPARISHSRCSRIYWSVPNVLLEIEAGAGGDELIHHGRVTR